jgi:hypothetical protein
MTALIGGSVLLIVVASVTLIMGWAGANEPLIYTSITSSVASFVCLALAYYRSKSEARKVVAAAEAAEGVAPAETIDEEPPDDALIDATGEHELVPASEADPPEASGAAGEPAALVEPLESTQAVPTIGDFDVDDRAEQGAGMTAEEDAFEEDAAEPPDGKVVAFRQRRKYHRPECRYAGAAGGESLSRSEAEARGYDACRLCKP